MVHHELMVIGCAPSGHFTIKAPLLPWLMIKIKIKKEEGPSLLGLCDIMV